MNKKDNLVWIDLEMTGLNPAHNVILEIASIVTDKDLNILAKGPSLVIHQPDDAISSMDEWAKNQHAKSGLLEQVCSSTITTKQAEEQTLDFIKSYCLPETAPLCGNSVWQDRIFLYTYMPTLLSYLHYRIVDVTSFKEIITRWYPHNPHAFFEKKDTHRALEDINESIAELKQYKTYFFVK